MAKKINKKFGAYIRKARIASKMKAIELAEVIGCARQLIHSCERGNVPGNGTLNKLCDVLQLDIEECITIANIFPKLSLSRNKDEKLEVSDLDFLRTVIEQSDEDVTFEQAFNLLCKEKSSHWVI